ncbi:FAD-dependent oxidoreductase [Desulfitobacterium sp. THU1]|uniref:FAD-dependent oxidoreductase n=1 Tax=Desulfitobacterium sp. THU1 TaxID=3138072 RepID=UPI00311FFBB9
MSVEKNEEFKSKDVSRRTFLRNAGILAGSTVVGASVFLGGCSTPSASQPASESKDWMPATWDDEADVVIVGSGGGLAGAVTAAEAGMDVIVLEKMNRVGGSTSMHSGVIACGGGTSIQKAAGITETPEAYAKYLLACAKGQANEELVTVLSTEFRDTFEWLAGLGIPFSPDNMYCTGAEQEPYCANVTPPVKHGVIITDKEHPLGGALIHEYVTKKAEELGVRLLMETSATKLITNPDGEVVGVGADSGGKSINIKARKGVILAGGGMCNNPEMMAQYMRYGALRMAAGGKGSTGDTIKMAQAIGADLVNMHESLTSPSTAVKLGTTTRGIERESFPSIIVNKWGQRYVNEDYHSDTVGKLFQGQEDGLSWQIFDGQSVGAVSAQNKEALIKANSIEELAEKTGIFELGLVNTLNRWNQNAANGDDPDYQKKGGTVKPLSAPFYAFKLPWTIAIVVQYGGIKVDEKCQAINIFGKPISRLYAAGIDAGGWLGRNYPGSGHGAGGGYAMSRIAARQLVEYANWDK